MADVLTQDNAEAQLVDTPSSPAASVVDSTSLTTSEQQNLAPSYAGGYYGDQNEASGGGFDPNAGTITTGPVANEANLTDSPFGPNAKYYDFSKMSPAEIAATGKLGTTNPTPDTISNSPIPNRLHDYPSYIYSLSWHLLTDEQYNKVIETQQYAPANVLVASAGRYSSSFPRNEFFSEDFYFDNLSVLSVISPTDNTRNTNAIDINFTLIEPYGFTLMERLLQAADAVKSSNYLDQPYMLQIDFFATGDDGTILGSVDQLRKRIPIKIIKLDVKVTVKGAEYSIQAIPFNHSAYNTSSVSTPANFEITASTVKNFFVSEEDGSEFVTALADINAANQREAAAAKNAKPAAPVYNSFKSYGAAINGWTRALKETHKIEVADVYKFQFDDEIGADTNTFIDSSRNTPKETPMTTDQITMRRSQISKTGTTTTKTTTPTVPTTSAPKTTTPTYTSGVVDQTYFIKAPGESDAAYALRMKNYAVQENAKIAAATKSAQATNAAISGSVDQTYFIKAPGESDAAYAKRMQDYATQQNARLGVATTIPKPAAAAPTPAVALYDPTKTIFQIQSGTTIEKLIEYVVRNSKYIQDQLVLPEDYPNDPEGYKKAKAANDNKPLKWFKIVPTVRLLDFDPAQKVWAREITYHVQKYLMYNIRADVGPQGVQLYPVKTYNYIYTGKNDDVFDFDIQFNALYYNQVTAYRDSLTDITPTASQASTDYQSQNAPNYSGQDPSKTTEYNAVMPLVMRPVVQNSKATATGGATTAREVASVDLADSLMTNSDADMLNLKLRILGDPDYIKQDEVFYGPPLEGVNLAVVPNTDPRLLPNNSSLNMDDGQVYVQVLFRTPTDIDENTGLMKFDSKYQHSVFSGLYAVVQVTSTFHAGQFTQELDLVRMPRQSAFDYTTKGQNKSDQRAESTLPTPAVDTPVAKVVEGGGADKSPAAAADGTADNQQAGQDTPIAKEQANEPPVADQNSKDLADVIANAQSADINSITEPQAIVPNFTPISIRGNQVPGQAAITG